MRFRLRTLLIVLALALPWLIAWTGGLSIVAVGVAIVTLISTESTEFSDRLFAWVASAACAILASMGTAELIRRRNQPH